MAKRSARETENKASNKLLKFRNDLNPIPFDWMKHGHHFRSKRSDFCDVQHILFVLDTSGSISPFHFDRIKIALSNLTTLFCKKLRVAAITFNHEVHLEFCFNCFGNTYHGREQLASAIEDIGYRGGWTHTGATARCVCQEMLDFTCGFSSNCLDVIFITDGNSNDPTLEICKEVKCLQRRSGVNTYAIGIGNYNATEIDCLSEYSDLTHAYEFENLEEFETAIRAVLATIYKAAKEDSVLACAASARSVSPTGHV